MSIADLIPTATPGLRVYGGIRMTDVRRNIDAENFDFQPAIASSGLQVNLSASLAADGNYVTLWDGASGPMLVASGAFAWGYVRGNGGTWYLEYRLATTADLIVLQMRSGGIHVFDTGNGYDDSGVAVRAIDRIRAKVLTGGTVTTLDGLLLR